MNTTFLNSNKNARLRTTIKGSIIEAPIVSIVVPIHNQELFIRHHLSAILQKIHHPFELIIINDASKDKSHREIKKFISEANPRKFTEIKYYETYWPWYETKCDDFGIRNATGTYIIEIQSDMLILEDAFDAKLIRALKSNQSLFAISARGVCDLQRVFNSCRSLNRQSSFMNEVLKNFKNLIKSKLVKYNKWKVNDTKTRQNSVIDKNESLAKVFPSLEPFTDKHIAGFIDSLIDILPYSTEDETSLMIERNLGNVWIGETVMRGPIIFERTKYLELGGLNTNAFFLGNDDQDLILRAKFAGYKVGFSPIRFASPLILGSTRTKKTFMSKTWFSIHKFARKKSFFESVLYRSAIEAKNHV
jgi:glycosyltransferase involved in cell wall biosynthesis